MKRCPLVGRDARNSGDASQNRRGRSELNMTAGLVSVTTLPFPYILVRVQKAGFTDPNA